MSIVLQYDRRSDRTYAYHNEVIWNKELKRSESTRTLIGTVGESGEVIPSKGTRRRHQIDEDMVRKEIEDYNASIRKKKELEKLTQSPEGIQLVELNRKYDEIKGKYDTIMLLLRSFADSVNSIK